MRGGLGAAGQRALSALPAQSPQMPLASRSAGIHAHVRASGTHSRSPRRAAPQQASPRRRVTRCGAAQARGRRAAAAPRCGPRVRPPAGARLSGPARRGHRSEDVRDLSQLSAIQRWGRLDRGMAAPRRRRVRMPAALLEVPAASRAHLHVVVYRVSARALLRAARCARWRAGCGSQTSQREAPACSRSGRRLVAAAVVPPRTRGARLRNLEGGQARERAPEHRPRSRADRDGDLVTRAAA